MIEQEQIDFQLRQIALSEANKSYKGAVSFPKEKVVERAKAYYNFLKGKADE